MYIIYDGTIVSGRKVGMNPTSEYWEGRKRASVSWLSCSAFPVPHATVQGGCLHLYTVDADSGQPLAHCC